MLMQNAYTQAVQKDTAFLKTAIHNSIALYPKTMPMGGQVNLYNGSEYLEPRRTHEQHPYFHSEDWLNGSVLYDGDWYENIPLQYDIAGDIVIAELSTNGNPLALVGTKVTEFWIKDHVFRKLIKDTLNGLPKTSYYDVLYGGNIMVVAHRLKQAQERIDALQVVVDFEERNRYYIFYGGRYIPVRSKRSVLGVLKKRQSELKKFIRSSGLSFTKNREATLARVAEFYDTIEH